jgi:hypothetical protein
VLPVGPKLLIPIAPKVESQNGLPYFVSKLNISQKALVKEKNIVSVRKALDMS